MEVILESIDDQVRPSASPARYEGLGDRQGGDAVGETDLKHHISFLFEKEVSQDVSIGVW
jgi:hypothetical protein